MLINIGKLGLASPLAGGGVRFEQSSTVIATGEDGIGTPGGWGVTGGTLSTSAEQRRPGHNTLKALANSGAADQFLTLTHKVAPNALTGNYEVWLNAPAPSVGSRSFVLTYSSDTPASDPPTTTPTNRRTISINPDVIPNSGWFLLQINKDGKVYSAGTPAGTAWVTTGAPDPAEVEQIRIFYTCGATVPDAERYFLTDQVAINGRGRPCVMIGFDGPSATHRDIALPLMQARGIKGYNAVDGDAAAGATAVLDPLYAAGWDVISQGIGHKNYSTSPGSLAADIVSARNTLSGLGYSRASDIFMYPLNARTSANDTVAASNGIRMGVALNQQHIPASSLGKLNLVGQAGRLLTDGVGVTFAGRWKAWVDECVLSGKSLIFYGHNLVTTPSDPLLDTSIAEFTALLDYIVTLRDAGLIEVVTPSQYRDRFAA